MFPFRGSGPRLTFCSSVLVVAFFELLRLLRCSMNIFGIWFLNEIEEEFEEKEVFE